MRRLILSMRASKPFIVVAVIFILMVFFSLIGQSESTWPASHTAAEAEPTPHHQHLMDLPKGDLPHVGTLAPELSLKTIDGDTVDLSTYRGKVVILNFWATWCIPCRVEMPHFQELWQAHREEGFEMFGIAIDRKAKRVRKTLKELEVTYPVALTTEEINRRYKVTALPTSFIFDRQGRISAIYEGFAYKEEYEAAIKPLLNQEEGVADTK